MFNRVFSAVAFVLVPIALLGAEIAGANATDSADKTTKPIGLTAQVRRAGSKVRFLKEKDKTVIDISGTGIGSATVKRQSKTWPKNLLLRLHFRGLESCRVATKNADLTWSVSSTGKPVSRVSLRKGGKETQLDRKSPYFAEVQIVSDNASIPLKSGYFQLLLPQKLLKSNPPEFTIRWVDFYRN